MFDSHFEVVLADSDLARSIHYHIRYKVYCLETGFENADQFPDGEEKDEFDDRSVHFMVRTKRTGEWIAAMRLVLPESGPLPVERHTRIYPVFQQRTSLGRIAEVSRLSMVENYRRRRQDKRFPCEYENDGGKQEETPSGSRERRKEPEILIGLLRALFVYCLEHDIDYLLFLTTPALSRLLTRLNLQLEAVGPPIQHRGLRCPYLLDAEEAYFSLPHTSPDIATMFQRPMAYHPFSQLAILTQRLH